eukprot:gene1223-193_t
MYGDHPRTAGWWCTVLHNVTDAHIHHLNVDAGTARDGIDVVSSKRVLIEDSVIEGSDDGLVPSRDYTVRRSYIGSTGCNALKWGSASESDFTNFTFANITLMEAPKAAI